MITLYAVFEKETANKVVKLVVLVCLLFPECTVLLYDGDMYIFSVYILSKKSILFCKNGESKYYSYLRASIGCNSAAFFAGQIHETIHIKKVKAVARTTTLHVMVT